MASWTVFWAILSAAAAFRGFGGASELEAAMAQIIFFISISALFVSLALSATRHPQR